MRNFAAMPQINDTPSSFLSVAQAAVELSLSHRTVLHRISAGRISATKLGPGTASYVITRDEIERVKSGTAA